MPASGRSDISAEGRESSELAEARAAANGVQDVGMSGLQGEAAGDGADDDGVWVLDARVVLFHHYHVQAGQERSPRCQVCRRGVAGAITKVEQASSAEGDGVVSSGGVDEEEAAASASVDGSFVEHPSYPGYYVRRA